MKINRQKYDYKDLKGYKQFHFEEDPNNNDIWYISFKGAKDTLYENETFKLKIEFNERHVSKYII